MDKTKEKPKKIFVKVLVWIILLVVGFVGNDIYNSLKAKPSLNVIMPLSPNSNGEFPITISNNGEVDLEVNKISIQSCYMKDNEWVYRYPDDLPSGREYIISFLDEKTYNKSQRIDCINNPLKDWESRVINMTICRNMVSGEIFVPERNDSFFMCGICYWNISVETNKKKFEFYEDMFLPVDFNFEIMGIEEKKSFDVNSSDVICIKDGLRVTYFGERELEIVGEFD